MANTPTSDGTTFKTDSRNVGLGVDALKADAAYTARAAADAAHSGASELRQTAQHAVAAAKEKFGDAKDMMLDQLEHAKKAASDAADSMKRIISRNPMTSVGIAVGVGFLVGMLVARSRN